MAASHQGARERPFCSALAPFKDIFCPRGPWRHLAPVPGGGHRPLEPPLDPAPALGTTTADGHTLGPLGAAASSGPSFLLALQLPLSTGSPTWAGYALELQKALCILSPPCPELWGVGELPSPIFAPVCKETPTAMLLGPGVLTILPIFTDGSSCSQGLRTAI